MIVVTCSFCCDLKFLKNNINFKMSHELMVTKLQDQINLPTPKPQNGQPKMKMKGPLCPDLCPEFWIYLFDLDLCDAN